jgi:indole-3-glycerol phosphate synthase
MPAYLETIIAAHRELAASDDRDLSQAIEQATIRADQTSALRRSFTDGIVEASNKHGMAVISEIKRRSPSKGDLAPTLDPAEVALEYEAGGAACLSVLTDREFFGGDPKDLQVAREACSLPVLRKDFTVSPLDLCDAVEMGADAVLLIVAALDDAELRSFLDLAARLALAALVEVHDAAELNRALEAGAQLVGVNQRDLRTFAVDHRRALSLGGLLPEDVVAVAESGIQTAQEIEALAGVGYRAVLVGETLLRAGDRRSAIAGLLGELR